MTYDSNGILDHAKVLIDTTAAFSKEYQIRIMSLRAAADQLEREMTATLQAQAFMSALQRT